MTKPCPYCDGRGSETFEGVLTPRPCEECGERSVEGLRGESAAERGTRIGAGMAAMSEADLNARAERLAPLMQGVSGNPPRPCNLCGATDHAWCGFCAVCKDHTAGLYSCALCQDQAYPGSKCPKAPDGQHVPDDTTEALSWCCGASGYAYDDAPEPWDD